MNGTTNMKAVVASRWEISSTENNSRPIAYEHFLCGRFTRCLGIIVSILLGIAVAFVGEFMTYNLLGIGDRDSSGLSITVATFRAIILLLLAVYRALVGGRRRACATMEKS